MKSKLDSLKLCLVDADRRFEIATGKISEITKRVHELEVKRNISLGKQFLSGTLDERNIDDEIYQEVAIGYRSLSRRKNELEEERNYYVKAIEDELKWSTQNI